MNYTESFDQFASRVGVMDLALYAGVGVIVWVLFREQLNPVKDYVGKLLSMVTSKTKNQNIPLSAVVVDSLPAEKVQQGDLFFQLVTSWKQTRDLAVLSKCEEAIKVADQMFPYLSPNGCSTKDKVVL